MSILEALALWRKIKPIIERLGLWEIIKKALAKFPLKADTTPVLPPNHPDRKRKWPEDAHDNTNG